MTARTLHKYEGYNICDKCHDNIFRSRVGTLGFFNHLLSCIFTQDYNDGKETTAERKKREEEEQKQREKLEKAKKERRCPECEKKVNIVRKKQIPNWKGMLDDTTMS
jgi:hypothetical protein